MANRISATLSPEDAQKIVDGILAFKALLPFLIEISKDERKRGQKIGQASTGFVRACLTAALNHPDILARKFKPEEFKRDLELFDALSPIDEQAQTFTQLVRDTILMIGKDLMEEANEVYADVKKEAKNNNSLKPTVDSLGDYYKRAKSEAKAATKTS